MKDTIQIRMYKKEKIMDRVTLIVPVYNVEKYLKRCIDSILNQSYKNIEIICVNDCSPDNSQEILNDYEKQQQIRVIINEQNMGLGKSRERALKESTGKYIMFIDSDDYIDTYYVEKYMAVMQLEDYDMVIGGYTRDVDGNKKEHFVKYSDWSVLSYTIACAKMYKKSFLIDNNIGFIDIRCGEDIFFSMELFMHHPKYYVMEDYAGYFYYFNRKSITGSMNADKKLESFIAEIFNRFIEKYPLEKMEKDVYWKICYNYITNMVNALIVHGHGCGIKSMREKYRYFMDDLNKKFVDYKKNPYLHFGKMKKQSLKIKISVSILMFLNKIGVDKLAYYLLALI